MKETIVIAIGGNAIARESQYGTVGDQYENITSLCDSIIDLVEVGYRVVLTHGNGPQVGNLLLKNEATRQVLPFDSLDICVSETQGSIGYLFSQTLYNRFLHRGIRKSVLTFITQVVVDERDPSFQHPTKPIGPFYTEDQASELERDNGFTLAEDSGRGYRRVVASPKPLRIVEKEAIKLLIEAGYLVLTVGGGGIPVFQRDGILTGAEAVIDKDHASALLAGEIGADILVILTGVEQVALDFGKPGQRNLDRMSVDEAKKYLIEGQFPAGSMGPKIEAACRFAKESGKTAIVTSIDKLKDALEGKTGTRIGTEG